MEDYLIFMVEEHACLQWIGVKWVVLFDPGLISWASFAYIPLSCVGHAKLPMPCFLHVESTCITAYIKWFRKLIHVLRRQSILLVERFKSNYTWREVPQYSSPSKLQGESEHPSIHLDDTASFWVVVTVPFPALCVSSYSVSSCHPPSVLQKIKQDTWGGFNQSVIRWVKVVEVCCGWQLFAAGRPLVPRSRFSLISPAERSTKDDDIG